MNAKQLSASHRRLCDEALQRLTDTACRDLPNGNIDKQYARKLQARHLIETLKIIESLVAAVKTGLENHSTQSVELCLEIINRSVALAAYCESLEGEPFDH